MSRTAEIWAYRGLTQNLVSRELKVKYKRSVLGWAWSLINPATTIAIYTLVFSVIFRAEPPLGGNGELDSFAIFLFNALVLWNFFQASITGSMSALAAAGDLRRKVYFPIEVPIISTLAANLVQTGMELSVLIGLLVVFNNYSWTFVLILPIFLLFFMFTFGISLVVGLANVYYRDVGYLVGVLLNFLLYLTPIIYPLSIVPTDYEVLGINAVDLLEANPLTTFVTAAREVLYGLEVPDGWVWLRLTWISVAVLGIGWMIFRRSAATVVDDL